MLTSCLDGRGCVMILSELLPRERLRRSALFRIPAMKVRILLFDVDEYHHKLLPAYRSYVDRSDVEPLATLLEGSLQVALSLQQSRRSSVRPVAVYQDYANILRRRVYYSSIGQQERAEETSESDLRLLVDRSIAPALAMLRCVPSTTQFEPEQDLSQPALADYLYRHSRWIEDYLTFAKEPSGPSLEVTLGDWCHLFSKEETRRFNQELSRMVRPYRPQPLAADFDNLRDLVHAAVVDTKLDLLISVL
jgi:hypothetical protein